MSDGIGVAVALRDLSQPESPERNGELVSSSLGLAEIELTDGGAPIPVRTLVRLQTSETVSVGHIESAEILGNRQCLRVRIAHWLALQDVSSIQKLWSQEQAD